MDSRFSFLRDLEREATPAPWATHLVDDTTVIANDGTTIAETFPEGGRDADVDFFSPVERHEADACFIAAMRNAMPGLIDELDRIERDLAAARAENDKLRAALAQAQQLEPAARDVLAERRRQVSAEGWDTKHDDHHTDGELAVAASCYANPVFSSYGGGRCPIAWPWTLAWWKPKDRRSDLVRAGALILAEIERLDRARAALAEKEPAK